MRMTHVGADLAQLANRQPIRIRFDTKGKPIVRWLSNRSKNRQPATARRGLKRDGLVFTDDEGGRWDVSVFRRSSVGAWWSKQDWESSHELAVLFKNEKDERVAIIDLDYDLDDAVALERLFYRAVDRRSYQDRRSGRRPIGAERRVGSDRRVDNSC